MPNFVPAVDDGTFRWTAVPTGWLVETPRGGAVKFADKKHTWRGAEPSDIDVLADGSLRLRVPSGWIVQTPKGGAEYIADGKHSWAPALMPTPSPIPVPSPSPTPEPSPEPQPAPSATPSPAPSASPTPSPAESDRLRLRPSDSDGVTETSPGVWRSNNLSKDRVAALYFNLSQPVPRGATLVIRYFVKSNVPIDNSRNIKPGVRTWLGKIGGTLNSYFCTQKSGNELFATELIDLISAKFDSSGRILNDWTRTYFAWPDYTAEGRWETFSYTYSTAPGKADGRVRFEIGTKAFAASRWKHDSTSKPGTADKVCIQMVYAPIKGDAGDLPAGSYVEWSRVTVEVLP